MIWKNVYKKKNILIPETDAVKFIINNARNNSNVLEFGAGTGINLIFSKFIANKLKKNIKIFAIENAPYARQKFKENYKLYFKDQNFHFVSHIKLIKDKVDIFIDRAGFQHCNKQVFLETLSQLKKKANKNFFGYIEINSKKHGIYKNRKLCKLQNRNFYTLGELKKFISKHFKITSITNKKRVIMQNMQLEQNTSITHQKYNQDIIQIIFKN